MNILKTVSSMALAFATMSASAELLYWQVQNAAFRGLSGADAYFQYATVRDGAGNAPGAGSESDYYKLYTVESATGASAATEEYQFWAGTENAPGIATSTYGGAQLFGDIQDTVSSLLFELWDGDGTLVGFANVSRSSWESALTTLGSGQDAGTGGVYTLSNVVPEPTSGLLLLLGMAGLALRRKRRA